MIRYLYVTLRAWPLNYPVPDMFSPPPAALSPEMVVIDLAKVHDIQEFLFKELNIDKSHCVSLRGLKAIPPYGFYPLLKKS